MRPSLLPYNTTPTHPRARTTRHNNPGLTIFPPPAHSPHRRCERRARKKGRGPKKDLSLARRRSAVAGAGPTPSPDEAFRRPRPSPCRTTRLTRQVCFGMSTSVWKGHGWWVDVVGRSSQARPPCFAHSPLPTPSYLYTDDSGASWITSFCQEQQNQFFCEVERSFIEDGCKFLCVEGETRATYFPDRSTHIIFCLYPTHS